MCRVRCDDGNYVCVTNEAGRQWKARLRRGAINCSFEKNNELQSKIQSMEVV